MKIRKGFISAAAAVLSIGSVAFAADSLSVSAPSASATPVAAPVPLTEIASDPLMQDTAPTPEKPLMEGLDKIGLAQPLQNLGINIYGFVEAGYSYDATVPENLTGPKSFPIGDQMLFNGPDKNKLILDQLDLTIERLVDASKGKFDVGFRVEGMFGRDAYWTHSNGILDSSNKTNGLTGEDQQLDLLQAYVTLAVPVGSGLTIKAGKFVTLLGYESIDPILNPFYSHSYSFNFGIPFTQTGVLASYNLTDQWNVTAGFTRGWNQSTSDQNGAIDFLGQAVYTPTDKLTVTGNLSVGPEGFHDNADYSVVPEIIAGWKTSDQLTLTADILYSYAANIAQWYGVATYASYEISKQFTLNGRLEFYHDGDSATTGAGNGQDVNLYEATAGVAVTPVPDNDLLQYLVLRPEIRFDWADHAAYDFSKFNQLTFAVDAYWQF